MEEIKKKNKGRGETITISNQKGGIGKTTTSVSIAAGLQELGYKTLLIDTDSQCDATFAYQGKSEGEKTIFDLFFEKEIKAIDCIQYRGKEENTSQPIGDLIAGDPLMKLTNGQFDGDTPEANELFIRLYPRVKERRLAMKNKCDELKEIYDYIIIDTAPAMSILLTNVLAFTDKVIIPLSSGVFGLNAFADHLQEIKKTKIQTNPHIKIEGLLFVNYKSTEKISQSAENKIKSYAEQIGTKIFKTKVRKCTGLEQSQALAKSIYSQKTKASMNGANDYLNVCREIAHLDIK